MKKSIAYLLCALFSLLSTDLHAQNNPQSCWRYVGQPGFGSEFSLKVDFEISSNGELFVVFIDYLEVPKPSVMKFNGEEWVFVGSPHFSEGTVDYCKLAIDQNDQLFIAMTDLGHQEGIGILKTFDGTDWVMATDDPFTNNYISGLDLKFNELNQAVIAYGGQDINKMYAANVKTLVDDHWEVFGNPNFSPAHVNNIKLAIRDTSTLYVAFSDGNESGRASVMRSNGENWFYYNEPGFSVGSAFNINIELNALGLPILAFIDDYSEFYIAKVFKTGNGGWQALPDPGFYPSGPIGLSMTLDSMDNPSILCRTNASPYKASVRSFKNEVWEQIGFDGFGSASISYPNLESNNHGDLYAAFYESGGVSVTTYDSLNVGIPEPASNNTASFQECFTITDKGIKLNFSQNKSSKINFEIYSISGRLVYQKANIPSDGTVPVPANIHGLYILRFYNKDASCIAKFLF